MTEMLGEKAVKKTKKIRVEGAADHLVKAYNARMQCFARHCYIIKHQTSVCRKKRESLAEHEIAETQTVRALSGQL